MVNYRSTWSTTGAFSLISSLNKTSFMVAASFFFFFNPHISPLLSVFGSFYRPRFLPDVCTHSRTFARFRFKQIQLIIINHKINFGQLHKLKNLLKCVTARMKPYSCFPVIDLSIFLHAPGHAF